MNLLFYELLVSRRLQAPAKAKEIRYRVKRTVKKGVVKFISSPIIEEPELKEEPRYSFYR
jgi:hypothetical protein